MDILQASTPNPCFIYIVLHRQSIPMDVPQETVDKIQRFAVKRETAEEGYDQQISSATLQAYNKKLDETLKNLQDRVRRQEDDLRKVCKPKSVQTWKQRRDTDAHNSSARSTRLTFLTSTRTLGLAFRKLEEPRRHTTLSWGRKQSSQALGLLCHPCLRSRRYLGWSRRASYLS